MKRNGPISLLKGVHNWKFYLQVQLDILEELKKNYLKIKNIELRLLVRNKNGLSSDVANNLEIIQGDTFDTESLKNCIKRCRYSLLSNPFTKQR